MLKRCARAAVSWARQSGPEHSVLPAHPAVTTSRCAASTEATLTQTGRARAASDTGASRAAEPPACVSQTHPCRPPSRRAPPRPSRRSAPCAWTSRATRCWCRAATRCCAWDALPASWTASRTSALSAARSRSRTSACMCGCRDASWSHGAGRVNDGHFCWSREATSLASLRAVKARAASAASLWGSAKLQATLTRTRLASRRAPL